MTFEEIHVLLTDKGISFRLGKNNRLLLEPARLVTAEIRAVIEPHEQDLIAECRALQRAAQAVQTITAKDLLAKEFTEPVWVVPGMIPAGLTILAGRPKLGKSWLMLAFAVAIALGGRVLGRIAVPSSSVLYAGLEDGERRLQERIDQLLGAVSAPDTLHLTTHIPRLDEGGFQALQGFLDAHPEVKAVFIDTWARVRPQRKNGSDAYNDDVAAVAPLQRLAIERNIAVVLIHHTRKAAADDVFDTISGSTGLTGVADVLLILGRARNDNAAILQRTGRDVEETEYALRFDPNAGTWALTDDVQILKMTPEARDVIEALRDEPLTPKQLAERLGVRDGTMRSRLHRMHGNAQLSRLADGRYEKHFRLLEGTKLPEEARNSETPSTPREARNNSETDSTGKDESATERTEEEEPERPQRTKNATNENKTTNATETTTATSATAETPVGQDAAEADWTETNCNGVAPALHGIESEKRREERDQAISVSGVASATGLGDESDQISEKVLAEPTLGYLKEMLIEHKKLRAASDAETPVTEGDKVNPMLDASKNTQTSTDVLNLPATIQRLEIEADETLEILAEIEVQMLEHLKRSKGITSINDPRLLVIDEPDEDTVTL